MRRIYSLFSRDENKDEEKAPAFLTDKTVGEKIASIINEHLEDIHDESFIKITRQLEFWYKEWIAGTIEETALISLAVELVHAATWRSRLEGDDAIVVPKVRFGRTELQMPIITCGGMRFQETWLPDNIPLLSLSKKKVLRSDSQKNLKEIIRTCIRCGLNHFETARMYGTSELQIVDALKSLIDSGEVKRDEFILQTKLHTGGWSAAEIEKLWKASWEHMQKLGHIDLFAFHLVSSNTSVDALLDEGDDNAMSFILKLKEEGKIRHIGFSSHGAAESIYQLVSSNKFDYINVHKHFFGDYHGEGTPDSQGGHGHMAAVQKAQELDMGVFIISPVDKGGKLFQPSVPVARAIGPSLTPIAFAALHAWKSVGAHTVSVGFARPSDLDEILDAATKYRKEEFASTVQAEKNLRALVVDALGAEWAEKGMLNIPSFYDYRTEGIAIGHLLSLHNIISAYGMYDYAIDRHSNLENMTTWKDSKTVEENTKKMPESNPGRSFDPSVDLSDALKNHYNPELVMEKLKEVNAWLHSTSTDKPTPDERKKKDWTMAYTLRVWDEFPGYDLTASKVLIQGITGGRYGINNTQERRDSLVESKNLRNVFRASVSSVPKGDVKVNLSGVN